MKIALDPCMFRALPLDEMVRTVAELGYQYIDLSPRDDFMPFFLHPRADDERVADLKNSLRRHGVQLSSVLPLYMWSSPDETERRSTAAPTGPPRARPPSGVPWRNYSPSSNARASPSTWRRTRTTSVRRTHRRSTSFASSTSPG